jgi:hypothetical protein
MADWTASLDTDWTKKVEFPAGMWNINLLLCVQTAPGTHPDFYQVGTRGGDRGLVKVTTDQLRPWLEHDEPHFPTRKNFVTSKN